MEYAEYINSKRWQRRRLVYFWTHDKKCAACGRGGQLHLHHMSYERMGDEPDEDLIPLCQQCHTFVHQAHQKPGNKRDLRQVTMTFVHAKQQLILDRAQKKAKAVHAKTGKPVRSPAEEGHRELLRQRAKDRKKAQKAFVAANRRGGTLDAPGGNPRLSGLPIVIVSQPKTS